MAKSKRPRSDELKSGGDRHSSRTTVSGPSAPVSSPSSSDVLAAKLAGTQDLASSIPFNANKPLEYDPAAATAPEAGRSVVPGDPLVTASAVTEMNGSDKVGSGAPTIGNNKTIASLDRVLADSTNRQLTTNQGVAIGDNQHSLKAGLREPTRADRGCFIEPC